MHADAQSGSPRATGTGPEAALARCPAPAWVIDPARGRVMAANAAGAARLGLHPDAASGTLDAAMPGLVRLRALMHEPLNGGRREPLIFWTAYGAENLLCNVSALAEPASPSLVLVSIVGAEEEGERALPAPPKAAAPTPSPDDAATMKRIARAIRTGFAKSKEEAPAPEEEAGTSPAPDAPQVPQAADVSKLAHELKTPLSAIVLAAEIMKDERFGALANERYQNYTSDIHDNARHALDVINRLLADSAPEVAAQPKAAEIDLNAIAESCVSGMRPLADKAELKLGQELHSRLPLVLADAMSVKQVLFNLLANAIKFTEPGGEVRVVTGLGFDRSVFIAVQDTGPGMSADEIARALNADAPPRPERKEAGGLGIGLPLAGSLAKSNGARIEIDSTPGDGTVVALVFPKDRVAAQRALPPPKSANESSN